jgi:phosphopantetheinyl transferase
MGLCKYWNIEDEIKVAFWQITESLEDLETLFRENGAEPDYEITHHPQKKREWLATRLLLRLMLKQAGVDDFILLKNETGKPYLLNSDYQISFTNTNLYVAVALSKYMPIGIDLEHPSEKLRRVAHKFLSEKEFTSANNNLENLCFYWCAKEAVYKHHGKKGLSFAQQIRVNNTTAQLILKNEIIDYQLFETKIADYLCVVAK